MTPEHALSDVHLPGAAVTGATARSVSPAETEELYMHLELDQLSADRRRPVSRAHLGAAAQAGLWALRIFCLVVGAMVIYTFIAQLG